MNDSFGVKSRPGLLKIITFVLLVFTVSPHFEQNDCRIVKSVWSVLSVKDSRIKSSAQNK